MIDIRIDSDIVSLLEWRKEVIRTVFGVDPSDDLMSSNEEYYCRHVADGSHLAYIVSLDGTYIGCGAICLTDELPSPDNLTGRCAYLMNIYIREAYRCHGYARSLIKYLVDIAKEHDCGKIYLESTDMARTLYESSGFIDMDNIMKYAKKYD